MYNPRDDGQQKIDNKVTKHFFHASPTGSGADIQVVSPKASENGESVKKGPNLNE